MSDIKKTSSHDMSGLTKGPSEMLEEVISVDNSNKLGFLSYSVDQKVHRTLLNRHVQLISIGGCIGTALFVSIGGGLISGGPLGLLMAYTFWTFVMICLTASVGEMVCYLPVPSPFITMAGRCVDEAFEFAAGWNFYLMESLYIPFEITAVNGMIHYWRDDYSPAITFCIQIFLYALLNIFAVRVFGESEFWLSIWKLIILMGLLVFTIVVMCGGNPQHDAFGFRNWHVEGGPLGTLYGTGANGHFQALLASLIQAAFTIVAIEYISMVAGEAVNPRKTMPTAFRTVLFRLVVFYVGGAFSVGVLVAYNDPTFVALYAASSNAASSPYVVAMNNLKIKVLPHIINVGLITSAFSAGNSYMYCSSRVLYGLAKRGHAPKIFAACTPSGVPIFGIGMAICFSLLSLLQLGSGAATVLSYMVSLCTGSQVLNYVYMSVTYIAFYRACNAQGIDRSGFEYRSIGQPYTISFAIVFLIMMVAILGYPNFLPGNFSTTSFIFNYIMVFVSIICIFGYKLIFRTKYVRPEDADLTSGLDEIEEHEYEYYAKMGVEVGDYKPGLVKRITNWFL